MCIIQLKLTINTEKPLIKKINKMSKCTDTKEDEICTQHPETCTNPYCTKHN